MLLCACNFNLKNELGKIMENILNEKCFDLIFQNKNRKKSYLKGNLSINEQRNDITLLYQ